MSERRVWQCTGVLVILDVLGWQNGKSELAHEWHKITDIADASMADALKSYPKFRGINCLTGVGETDSYFIAAWRESNEIDNYLIEFASVIANVFFGSSWHAGLPLRGCLTIGDFQATSDFHIGGDALQDARQEFNAMNWVGCHATAKATKILDAFVPNNTVLKKTFVMLVNPPYKDLTLVDSRWVLNWPYQFYQQPEDRKIREIMQSELGRAANDKDKKKHETTIQFFEKVYSVYDGRNKPKS